MTENSYTDIWTQNPWEERCGSNKGWWTRNVQSTATRWSPDRWQTCNETVT